MLGVLLALYATSVVASPSGPKPSSLHRRMEVQNRPDMAKEQYTPGKIPVTMNVVDGDAQRTAWIAKVGISGNKYDLMLDTMLSTSWLYSPGDKYKCEVEAMRSTEGKNYCYMLGAADKPLDGMQPFMLNYTGFAGQGVSGTRSIVTPFSCPEMNGGAKLPVAVGLVDNIYSMYGGGSLPDQRLYHGVFGLSKKDVHVFEIGEKKEHIYQTPFHASSGWDYFTTYFSSKAPADQTYIGLQYMDEAAKMGEFTTIPSTGDEWSVTADATWEVKVWEKNLIIGNENKTPIPETRLNYPFPAVNMSQTANVHFDLGSSTTFVDIETAKAIYKAYDGSCSYFSLESGMMDKPKGGPMVSRIPLCTFPVDIYFNKTSGEEWVMPSKAAKVSLPFGKFDVQIDPDTMIDLVDGPPCSRMRGGRGHAGKKGKYGEMEGKEGMENMGEGGKEGDQKMTADMMGEVITCKANAYGKIQPNVFAIENNADQDKMYWKYGDVFFQNAFVKWTTGANPSIGVAEYAQTVSAKMAPAPNGSKREGKGKKRTSVRYKKHLRESEM
ncbi:hypothetical protein TWF718_007524 [Orbilia javanica]|uniref:Uncharacterized protein n=1 Tax=Orbilia javanica TaxID=47235 RepID=A0AAN8N313_9PEZI